MKALKTIVFMAIAMLVLSIGSSAVSTLVLPVPVAQTVNEGVAIDYTLPAATGAVGPVTYALTSTPVGASFNPATQKFTWTPDYSAAAVYTMTYTATDDNVLVGDSSDDIIASQNFVVTVNNFQPLSITENVLLGGPDQTRSNPDADDAEWKTVYAEKTFTITNNGGLPVDISGITSTAVSKYNVTFTGVPATIAANASVTVTVKGFVPKELASFFPTRTDYNDRKNDIGDINVATTTSGVAALTANLFMEAENKLNLNKLYVYVDGDSNRINEDGKEVTDIKPGAEIEVTATLENKYDDGDNENLDIENIEMTVEIDDSDVEVDESVDFDDLAATEDAEQSITFTLDQEDVEETTYKMYVTINAEDENGAVMGYKYAVDLDIKKKTHDIAVTDVSVTPDTGACPKTARLQFTLVNIGKHNEEEVSYKIDSPLLGISKTEYDLELDSRDDITRSIVIPLDGVKAGDYDIELSAYYDRNSLTGSETATLSVAACTVPAATTTTTTETKPQPTQTNAGNELTGQTTTQPPVTIVPEMQDFSEFQTSSTYMMLLGGLVVVLTIALILLLVKFVF
jgi:hypothetical protein